MTKFNSGYFLDGAQYCKAAEQKVAMPDWFGFLNAEHESDEPLLEIANENSDAD